MKQGLVSLNHIHERNYNYLVQNGHDQCEFIIGDLQALETAILIDNIFEAELY